MSVTAAAPSLLVVTTIPGTMHFLVPYVRHFRALGWRVDGAANGLSTDSRADEFDRVHDVPLSRSLKDVRGLVAGSATLASIMGSGYDIVHVHTPIASFVARLSARRMPRETRPAIVYTAHGFHFHAGGHPLANAAFIIAEQIAGRWTDRVVVINREDYEAAVQHKVVPRRRLRYMPGIGVDTDWYSRTALPPSAVRDALDAIGMNPDCPYFVTVGEFSRRKRPEDVVRALAQMQDRRPWLLLLGEGPTRALVEDAAEQAGVRDRITMPGSVADIRPLVSGALALVQASSREGLPRSIMEALSLEVPVIATSARGQAELVGTNRGVIVPIGGIAEMSVAMDRLARDPAMRAAMGARGRQLMAEHYDTSLLIEEHERLYAELLEVAETVEPSGPAIDG